MMTSLLKILSGDSDLLRIVRFGIVGVAATAVYLAFAISLPALSSFAISPTVSSIIASMISIFVSYFGHHKFTFTKSGQHNVYLPRFLAIAALLSTAAAVGTYVQTEVFAVEYRVASLVVAVCYPIASFTLNRMLVFRDRHVATAPEGNRGAH